MQAVHESNQSQPTWLLLIEDNPDDVRLLKALLQEQADYHIDHLPRLTLALEWLQQHQPDMILLDLQLPDSAGLDTLQTLHTAFPELPIVVLTGYSDGQTLALRCIEHGAHDFLSKADLQPLALRRVIGYAISRVREYQLNELRLTLARYQTLSSATAQSLTTRQLAGVSSVKARVAEDFLELTKTYCQLLDEYLESMVVKKAKPQQTMVSLVTQLGNLGAGPRDLVDLHKQALEQITQRVTPNRAHAYMVEGRLLALEMMGLLVDYYRLGIRHQSGAIAEE